MLDIKKINIRILHLLAVLLLIGLFLFPLWRIKLEAPQYPEGIEMYIWINKITGSEANTLNSINILNHYIGMKAISPESIPELKYFPIVNIVLLVLGFLVFLLNKKYFRLSWTIILIILAGLAVYDFYLWEYEYGHNLEPGAPIQIPGMVYQPPLLGTKWLLNFKAFSFPHVGGILLALSIVIAIIANWIEFRKNKSGKRLAGAAGIALLAIILGCNVKPEPIAYNSDACSVCSMVIADARYGTEIVNQKGKIYKFDSIECLIRFLSSENTDETEFSYILITDYLNPGELSDAQLATYLISKQMPSPMGAYLTAFSEIEQAKQFQQDKGGLLFNWDEVKAHLISEN